MTARTLEYTEIQPPRPPGPLEWVRQNLFNSWFNSVLTVILFSLVAWALYGILGWAIFTADWRPVVDYPILYMVGQYPLSQLWRLGVGVMLTSLILGTSWRVWGGVMRTMAFTYALFLLAVAFWPSSGGNLTLFMRGALIANLAIIGLGYLLGGIPFINAGVVLSAWLFDLVITYVLIHGVAAIPWLPDIPTGQWGGLLVTLLLAVGGIVISFPIGVALALGRRSSLPVVSFFSTAFIEVVRGVPLIGILFLSSLILPLFLPPDVRIDRLLRALIGMTLFSAAYMAENVRGGLAAVPSGQVEAAKALGLSNFKITTLIVLPQALRAVIPPMVGQFISLFKDTTLASGVAVLELLSVGRSILQSNPEFIGMQMEVFLFIAIVFWIFSYLMSYASLRLEVALGVGKR
jgi:general L-amino acid transport system permease protein